LPVSSTGGAEVAVGVTGVSLDNAVATRVGVGGTVPRQVSETDKSKANTNNGGTYKRVFLEVDIENSPFLVKSHVTHGMNRKCVLNPCEILFILGFLLHPDYTNSRGPTVSGLNVNFSTGFPRAK
jgi:hypothetical protein